ncbi:MAG TPA: radical SAM protein [Longimicrobiales bacterium]|nr:radical SAM protein [Longimicrobiales bacterium]
MSPAGPNLPTVGIQPVGDVTPGMADWTIDPARHLPSDRPHIVAWNLTRRCNLTCAHCYISAGSWHAAADELPTADCLRILDQILDVNPSPVLILSGGEPLLRDDLETLAERAATVGATVVVGTNGTRLTDERVRSLMDAGVKGVAVSVDSLRPAYHDRFRHGQGALSDTLAAVDRLVRHGLDFVVQMSLTRGNRDELADLAAWSADRGAVSFNAYFLVQTGRGEGMPGLEPEENEAVLRDLVALERTYRGRMMVRSKCQPQIMRHVIEAGDDSPLLNYGTRCPCGVHYCRITPEGKVTPCPYSPVVAGDLNTADFGEIWRSSPVFTALRQGTLEGRCGRCEYRKVCGGCRARAYALNGSLLGADDSCVYDPSGRRPVIEPRPGPRYGQPSDAHDPGMPWSPDARARIERIPSFVRGVVRARVEAFARERGYESVDLEVMAEVRREMPVDFSRRLPFFLRNGGEA